MTTTATATATIARALLRQPQTGLFGLGLEVMPTRTAKIFDLAAERERRRIARYLKGDWK